MIAVMIFKFATAIASLWVDRKNRNTKTRSQARASVSHLKPAVVVTGAARGIGLALAREFLSNGRTVVLVARDSAALSAAAASLQPVDASHIVTLTCDVTELDAPQKFDQALAGTGCYLDVLINNAGVGLSGPFSEAGSRPLEDLIALNIAAVTRLTHHALPSMLARGRGGILNIASLGGAGPGPNQAAYYASKAYVISLTEAIASEVSGRGVRVSVVAPGVVKTGFHAAMGADGAPYRTLLPSLSPEAIARSSYRWFMMGQRVIVPGLFYRVLYVMLRLSPRPISGAVTGWLLKNPRH